MKNLKQVSRVFLFLSFLFISKALIAQNEDDLGRKSNKISGNVFGSDKNPLIGASIKIKGRNSGTKTDANGNFTINASPIDTLVVSYINYTTQYVRVGTKVIIPIILIESNTAMNEVIVIAYGSVKKKELTGVVGKVNMEDVKQAPVPSFDEALAGRIAGVTVSTNDGQPGAASSIVIRGSSAGQDVSPLYVVDGFPIENMDINSINTNDIESIEVLKDASSIAMYGARGANGVIVITTKKGKTEPMKVVYSFSDGFQDPTRLMKLLSPYQFVKLQLDLDSMQSTSTTSHLTGNNYYINPTGVPGIAGYDPTKGVDLNYYKDSAASYDWQKLLIRQGALQTHNLSIIGGTTAIHYAFNGAYTDQKGVIINTGLTKYDGKAALDIRTNDKSRFGVTLNYSNTTSYGTIPTQGGTGGVVSNMWTFRPVDELGKQGLNTSTIDSSSIGTSTTAPDNLVNPVQEALNVYRKNITRTTTLNSYFEYNLTNELHFRISGGINNTTLSSVAFYNSLTSEGTLALNSNGVPYNTKGMNGLVGNTNNNNYVVEATLAYRKRYDQYHIMDAIIGTTYDYGKSLGNSYTTINILPGLSSLGYNAIGSGTPTAVQFGGSQNQLKSYLGRVNYSLQEKYIFTVTGRADGSSKFKPGKEWGFFPSAAVAWRFTQEDFLRKYTSFMGESKLRATYGAVGNNRVNDYAYLYENANSAAYGYPFNGTYVNGMIPYFPGNPNMSWETSYQLDLGTTLSFFKDKVLVDMDYYNKRTVDALLPIPLPMIAAYAGTGAGGYQYQNGGVIRNRGFELSITTTNIQKVNFIWTSSFNIAFNKNKILSLYNNRPSIQTPWGLYGGQTAWIAKVGSPISQFYGYKSAGLYQYSDFNQLSNGTYVLKPGVPSYTPSNSAVTVQPGDPKYADLNHDGVIDDNDRTVIGNPMPIHTGGLTNNLIYKNFSLNILLQWSYGNQLLNANKMAFETGGYYANSNQFAVEANHWTPTNPTNDIPRPNIRTNGQDAGGLTRVSSWLVEDASFLRLKTVSFGYMIPANLLKRTIVSSIRVFISAQNLWTFTKYSGLDPEVSTYRGANPVTVPGGVAGGANSVAGVGYLYIQPSSGSPAFAQGYDYTPYPRNRTITLGATVVF